MTRSGCSGAALLFVAALVGPHWAVAQTVRYVDNIDSCGGLTPCHATIADALSAAGSGDTIEIFPGVYQENVTVASTGGIVLQAHVQALRPMIAPASGDAVVITASPQAQVLHLAIEAPNGSGVTVGGPLSSGYVIEGNWIKASNEGIGSSAAPGGTVRGNTLIGGGLHGDLAHSLIEGNTFVDAGILLLEGGERPDDNVIRGNVLRRGGIDLDAPAPGGNTIESNFVSGSPGDGIRVGVPLNAGGGNLIQFNTSIENTGCDITDPSEGGNTWANNRFATKCGAATE